MSAESGAVFVMPRRSTEWADAPGLWVTAAGWARATRKRLGVAWVVTRDGVYAPEEVDGFTKRSATAALNRRARLVPQVVRTAAKDAMRMRAALRDRDVGERREWSNVHLGFVWQHHDPFNRAGEALARRRECPLVAYVHAPQVWEARQWGVRRPGWSRLLEYYGDRPPLLAADVVACVSEEVVEEVVRLGVPRGRTLVSPMAVDVDRFSPSVSGLEVRRRLGLEDDFIIGWTGTFRKFHGLDTLLDAFAVFAQADALVRLLLVGDGPGRSTAEDHARALGIQRSVVFAGAVATADLPAYIAAMDVAVVSAPSQGVFHYSPQKLREYLSAGKPSVAPRLGDVARTVDDGVDSLLYEPGDTEQLCACLSLLREDPMLRARLGDSGRRLMMDEGSWDTRLADLLGCDAFRA